jgi:alkylation response protein AidB-like acyl-CoA dehydrogenase
MMDFAFTEEQERLREETTNFARVELSSNLVARDAEQTFDAELWRRCAEFGILGSYVPVAYGGYGRDVMTTVAMMESLGYGCADNGLTLALNGQMWAVQEPIQQFGTEDQKKRYLPLLTSGGFGAHAMSESGSGSDTFSLATTATKTSDGYVLNGNKSYIGLGPVCDVALVFASTDPSIGRWGITAFLVDGDAAGLTRSGNQPKMGLRTGPFGELTLEDCFVPTTARLGPEGAGASIFTNSMDWERSFIFASHVGSMARQLDESVDYARTRQQFGQPIGKFQSVSNRIADMQLRLETARLLLYKAAWLIDTGQPAQLASALANLHLAESFVASSMDAIRIHGAKGYLSEFGVERDLRDALGGVIYSGTSDIQRQVIARLLGL